MTTLENQPLLESSSDQASNDQSKSSETKTSGLASDTRLSLTPNGSAQQPTTSSSSFSLRFFKTDNPALPTVWQTQPTESSYESNDTNLMRNSDHGSQSPINQAQFFMQIVRASVGTGVLALPSAVANAGLAFGMVGIFVTSSIIIHSVHLLVECSHFLRERYGLTDVYLDYGNTVEYCFVFGTSSARRFRWFSKVLNVCLATLQFGIITVYLLFVSENIKDVVDHYQPQLKLPLVVYMACVSAVMLPLIFIRSIRCLTLVSGAGNIVMMFGLVFIFIYCFQNLTPPNQYPLITDIERIPLFFGIAVFSFESINVVLPTEMALANKDNLLGPCGLLYASFFSVLIVYLAVAFFGYITFGESVQGSLTYSLPFSPWYAMIVKPLYAILIAMSFGLQYYILMDITWQAFEAITPSMFHKRWIDNVMRVAIYLVVFGIGAGVPYIEHVISLVGALSGSSICLIIPPLIYTILFWDHSYRFRSFKFTVTKNILIIVFGIFGAIIGSYTSILAIYKEINVK